MVSWVHGRLPVQAIAGSAAPHTLHLAHTANSNSLGEERTGSYNAMIHVIVFDTFRDVLLYGSEKIKCICNGLIVLFIDVGWAKVEVII